MDADWRVRFNPVNPVLSAATTHTAVYFLGPIVVLLLLMMTPILPFYPKPVPPDHAAVFAALQRANLKLEEPPRLFDYEIAGALHKCFIIPPEAP